MSTTPRPTLNELLHDLDSLWSCLDETFAALTPRDWAHRHGKDWTVADVPYHLAYFDRELIANAIVQGPDVPLSERRSIGTGRELDDWNAAFFARRPAGQTPAESLAQMRASRQLILGAVSVLTNADLDRPTWCPLPGLGWQTLDGILTTCIGHTWNHLTELRLRLKQRAPLPTPAATRRAVGFYIHLLPHFLDRDAAARFPSFTMTFDFTGPAASTFTYRVANGRCAVTAGRANDAALVLTLLPETFIAMSAEVGNPLLLLLTRRLRVRGFKQMGTFAKLFPTPQPETTFPLPSVDLPTTA